MHSLWGLGASRHVQVKVSMGLTLQNSNLRNFVLSCFNTIMLCYLNTEWQQVINIQKSF